MSKPLLGLFAAILLSTTPRDVKPGAQYADAIVRTINEAQAVVLVLSANSLASSHVGREVGRASSKHKQIMAFRIDAGAIAGLPATLASWAR